MAQKKLLRFNQIKSFPHVWEYPKEIAGTWHQKFGNPNPLVLELACGRGEYTVGLASLHPEQNFLGVDVKGNRIYVGAKRALDMGLKNAGFLRTQIEMLSEYFHPEEISEIWLTFPDPQLRTSKSKKRLTHPRFLRIYQKLLKKEGIIHLKTDSPDLYRFTLQVINMYGLTLLESNENVYGNEVIDERLKIKTHYEGLDIAKSQRIFYLRFMLQGELPDKDQQLQDLIKETEQKRD
jgi:tRNA (guanine-N7-)-methyltransferase